ncbi:hypothetical protein BpHYR1_042265 [Brachionus plicatilis]|uniref:Nucleolar protein 12 n=1 Tax=Brachionus plicatilis TaxID=10195 RepID=A0A3M7R5I5_BRAPC|nr:hypothetical protein BpHYR1_042265 [Brachionus plicatilis]
MGKSRIKNTKSQIVFNEEERANYLLGFRKRKQERKKKAREELDQTIRKEKKRQRELKAQSILDERKKAGLPLFNDKVIVSSRDVIDTGDNEIIISDFSSSKPITLPDEEQNLTHSEKTDAEINQAKVKASKECSLINERLTKLEKHKRAVELSNTKAKKNYLKSRKNSKNSKSAKKFNINKSKQKKKIKNSKK